MRVSIVFTILLAMVFLRETADSQETIEPKTDVKTIATLFTSDEGFVFDARIVLPPKGIRNGYGVLMIGGGVGNDLNWSSPGFYEYQGNRTQYTISGKTHADAPVIAASLASEGYVVMYWSTIRQTDPKRDKWPNEATVYPVKDLLRFLKSAIVEFRSKGLFEQGKLVLLGHSMGAIRAANIAARDDRVKALVLLASAQLTRTDISDTGRNMNKQNARELAKSIDTNGDGVCNGREFLDWSQDGGNRDHPLANQPFESLDFHPDKELNSWEISAGLARHKRSIADLDDFPNLDGTGMQWTEDILSTKKIDTLIVYGTLDEAQAHHAPIIADLVKSRKLYHVDLKILPGVGHQLGPEVNGLIGPISQHACQTIVDWLQLKTRDRSK